MIDQRHEIPQHEQRLATGKGNSGDTPLGGGIDHALDVIQRQAVPRKAFVDVHPALRTGGVAPIGQLDHQLARQTAVAEKMEHVS